jgi:tyrosine-protein phosphatase SIW14
MRSLLILSLFAMIVGGPIAWHYGQKKNYRNLRIVDPGVLYRSGLLSPAGLEAVVKQYGIKTVINFRAMESGDPKDRDEETYCQSHGIRYERILYRLWHAPAGEPIPGDQSVAEFLKLMDQRQQIGPILVHCLAGKHRTGAFVAIYRMDIQGWPNAAAISEMQEIGYDGIANEDDVRGYLERYAARKR